MIPELISAIFTGLSVVITAIGGILALRKRSQREEEQQEITDNKYLRRENGGLKRYNLASTRHMYRLEMFIASKGYDVPTRPVELQDDPDLPDTPSRDDTGSFGVMGRSYGEGQQEQQQQGGASLDK